MSTGLLPYYYCMTNTMPASSTCKQAISNECSVTDQSAWQLPGTYQLHSFGATCYGMQDSSRCVPEVFSPVLEVKGDSSDGLAPHAVLTQLSPEGILSHLALLLCSFLA